MMTCRYNGVIDVWSAGCVLAEMCLHRPLFPGKTEAEQMDLIMKVVGTPTEVAVLYFFTIYISRIIGLV